MSRTLPRRPQEEPSQVTLQDIRTGIQDIHTGSAHGAPEGESERPFGQPSKAVRSGWESADQELFVGSNGGERPGLARGSVHEWIGLKAEPGGNAADRNSGRGSLWSPPLFLLTHLARRAVEDALERGAPTHVVWIGRQVWPYPRVLEESLPVVECGIERCDDSGPEFGDERGRELDIYLQVGERDTVSSPAGPPALSLLEHSLFVDPGDVGQRLWAIDTSLRCAGVTAIVADGSGLGMAATRRLQLAAQAADALVLLTRPPSEAGEISAATTRWYLTRVSRGTNGPLWRAELLRAKGVQQLRRGHRGAPASRSA